MASISKRTAQDGSVTFAVQVRLKGAPAQSATFTRLTDAKQWAASTESAIREGRHFKAIEAKRRTLKELIDRYKADVLPQKKNAKNQKLHYNWWSDKLGAYLLCDVTPARIAEMRDQLRQEGKGPATQVRYLAALSHAFTVAVKEYGWIDDNPVKKVSRPKEPRGRTRFLSNKERAKLLEAAEKNGEDIHLFVMLALTTGARKDELRTATWNQIDLTRRTITFYETKSGETRTVPLAGRALEMLKQRQRRLDTPLLFPGRNPKKPATLRKPWEAVVKEAGISNFRIHDLRHTAASYLAMNGASLLEIAAILGHKTLEVTKRYSHLTQGHLTSVIERTFGENF